MTKDTCASSYTGPSSQTEQRGGGVDGTRNFEKSNHIILQVVGTRWKNGVRCSTKNILTESRKQQRFFAGRVFFHSHSDVTPAV